LNLPNFIIAGGVATGTSFLSHAISRHPDIYLPKVMRPETGFFYKSWEYSKGLDYYSRRWFSDWAGQSSIGERSSLYLHGDFLNVPERIFAALPKVKLIFCLRNPIERAYANYRFSVLSGFETRSFATSLELEDKRFQSARGWKGEIQPNLYRRRGEYARQLSRFFNLFPRENILIIKSEEMARNPEAAIRQVCSFLQISYVGFDDVGSFGSRNVKSPHLQSMFRRLLRSKLDVVTEGLREQSGVTLSKTQKLVSFNLSEGKEPIDAGVRAELFNYYLEHNIRLTQLLGIDTSDWN